MWKVSVMGDRYWSDEPPARVTKPALAAAVRYSFNPPSINKEAHAEAVRQARLFARYGTTDVRLAWARLLAMFRKQGVKESDAIIACARAHPDLYAQQLQVAPPAAPTALRRSQPSPERQAWERAVQAKQATGLSRTQAILAVGKARPDLFY
ncbi:MAG TPA: hypothetical protein VGJ87_14590 [Roseiflexaceae bacterium]|jgi:hypothetical protein